MVIFQSGTQLTIWINVHYKGRQFDCTHYDHMLRENKCLFSKQPLCLSFLHYTAGLLDLEENFFWLPYIPVLSTFLMTTATCPFSMELSSLTMRMRQVQRTNKDRARRMRPTARSGKVVSTKRCLPELVPSSGFGAMAIWKHKKLHNHSYNYM
uniref:Uncharacterized protein n=1 Tax=Monopterus albus TaxID=43700 RepID=A0A3Q3JU54_MONAL